MDGSSETNESRGTEEMFGECHAHIIMDGVNYRHAIDLHRNGPDDNVIREHLKIYQDRGIIFVRDGGDALGVSARAKELAPEYGIHFTLLVVINQIHVLDDETLQLDFERR